MTPEAPSLSWFALLSGLAGGLALFLLGTWFMTQGLVTIGSRRIRNWLGQMSSTVPRAVTGGLVATFLVQSSSVTTLLLVGLSAAGYVTLQQCAGMLLGANLGSSLTVQVLAFNITDAGSAVLLAGTVGMLFGKGRMEGLGRFLVGIGLLLVGMDFMSRASLPLRDYGPFVELLASLQNPLLGMLVGMVFTGIVQSSAAVAGLLIVLGGNGAMTLPAAIAILAGAEVGTCFKSIVASLGKPRAAMRMALLHFLYNMVTAVVVIAAIVPFEHLIIWVTPGATVDEIAGAGSPSMPRQIANASLLFNVVMLLLFAGTTGLAARLVQRIVPDARTRRETLLDPSVAGVPALALARARIETCRLGRTVLDNWRHAWGVALSGSAAAARELSQRDDRVDRMHAEIVGFLSAVSSRSEDRSVSEESMRLSAESSRFELLGDVAELNLASVARARDDAGIEVLELPEGLGVLAETLWGHWDATLVVLERSDKEVARQVIREKAFIKGVADAVRMQVWEIASHGPAEVVRARLLADLLEAQLRALEMLRRICRAWTGIEADEVPDWPRIPAAKAPEAPGGGPGAV